MKKYFMSICSVLLIAAIIINYNAVQNSVRETIAVCLNSVLPSVFPFLVLSSIIVSGGITRVTGRPLSKIFRKLFGVSECSSTVILLGLTAGFPVGASSCCELYKKGEISKEEAEYLLSFCSNSGISFIFGVIGGTVFGSIKAGLIIYFIQVLSSVITGLLLRGKNRFNSNYVYKNDRVVRAIPVVVGAVKSSVINMAYICGYILFFAILTEILLLILPSNISFMVKGICELTCASYELIGLPLKTKLVLACGILSWCGASVHMQVRAVTDDLSLKQYFTGKLVHMASSMTMAYFVPINQHIGAFRESIVEVSRDENYIFTFLLIIFIILSCIFANNSVK